MTLPTATGDSQDLTTDCSYISSCPLVVIKECFAPAAAPVPFNCSDSKPIDTLMVKWNGSTSPIWVKAWNGNIGSGTAALFGPVATGDTVTFTRSGTFPNDIYFELFTSAGISTGSGIPDFRGPSGVWERRQPVYYQDFMASEAARIEHWDYKLEGWAAFRAAQPNATHRALVELERAGKLLLVAT